MPSDTAKVTGKGFYFQGAYYSSPTAIRKEWFAKARKESWTVNVSYDPRNLAIVYLRDESLEKGYEPCKLLDHCADHAGKSLVEITELGDDAKLITAKGENERQEKRMMKDKKMSEIESKAKKAKKAVADPHASKSSQLAHMSTNKAEEKDYQRSLEHFDMTSPAQKTEAVNTALDSQNVVDVNDYRNRELAKLTAKRKLREGK